MVVDTCDVLIVGGGPAGAACAWKLRQAGADVLVIDKATFPRDKVCAGWITPQVIDDLRIDLDEYSCGRTLQPMTGFKVGLVGRDSAVEARYERPVSFGIRRCEFDNYLLRRSGARVLSGAPVSSVRRERGGWLVNGAISTPLIVGAGGHFCPIARMLNGVVDHAPVVAAQEVEQAIDPGAAAAMHISPEVPELYFSRDLAGYGWCLLKGRYLNVGFGALDRRGVPAARARFVEFLNRTRQLPDMSSWRWKGHAYLVAGAPWRRVVGDGVMLAGDAAGLAAPQSGEGIRPAIESGLMAASTIIEARGAYDERRLAAYADRLWERFDERSPLGVLAPLIPARVRSAAALPLFALPYFVRHFVLDRWFLHAGEPALAHA